MWLLNNDTLLEKDCLYKIIKVAESSNAIGMVSPMIYFAETPDKLQFGGCWINRKQLRQFLRDWRSSVDIGSEFQTGKDVCLWGTALLIKRGVVEKIGYLQEKYFAYFEDIEYSLRVLDGNFKNVVCNTARILHKHQSSKGKHYYYFMNRNQILFGQEYLKGFVARLRYKIRTLGVVSAYIDKCNQEYADACLDGVWHGLINISGEMTSDRRMPKMMKKIMCFFSKYHPTFIADVITLDYKEVYRKILKKIKLLKSK